MALFDDDIFEELERMRRRINQLTQRMWQLWWPSVGEELQTIRSFPVDISETEDDVIVRADLPGFSKEDISLHATENTIEIVAQKKQKKVERTEKMYLAERKFGEMRRFLTLPARVDYEKAEANFENGVLTVRLPKKEKKKVGKKIEVK
jgi:HSP20 family protein